ncbi:MAG: serine/threonine protein kinase [Deltaproteobacteria bacterium]|nr:MAG: serine/threonine protein kinase [Deltaproteobacteria bacterium]
MASDDAHRGPGSAAHPTAPPSASQPLAQAEPPDPMIGVVIDRRYRVLSKIGEGGMGQVYKCEHVGLKKQMAVKLLRTEIVSNPEAVQRFHQEAQSASSIGHRNIIDISDVGSLPDGRVYMCMELLDGQPMSDLIRRPLDPARILHILIQTCDGLAAAHRHGIVHRDMKPENIFVTVRDGMEVPKLLDFGIAKVTGNDGQNNLTRTGTIFGTPYYMAPEQALGQPVDHRADIYSLGVILYEAFTGSVPFKAESFMAILTQHITTEPMPPEQMAAQNGWPQPPPPVVAIIQRCMRKEPAERYASMDELKAALIDAYRAVAGPGMSAYLDAQRASAAYGGTPSGAAYAPPMPTPVPAGAGYGTPTASGIAHGATGRAPSGMAYADPGAASGYGELAAPPRRRGWLWAVVGLLVVGGGAAGGYLWWQGRQGGDGAEGGRRPAHAGAAPAGVRADPDAGGARAAGARDAAIAAAPAADAAAPVAPAVDVPKIAVLVNSRPQGAEVYRDGTRLGTTPLIVDVPKGQPTELQLRRARYHDATIVVDGSRRKVTQKLVRHRGGSSDRDGNKPGDGTKPGDQSKPDDRTKPDDGKHKRPKDGIEDGLIDDDSDLLE